MIIVNKNSERKHNNKFLFSKIIKLKIPKPNKLKQTQQTSQFNERGKRQLSIMHKMAIDKMTQNLQCPVRNKSIEKEPRYSRLQRSTKRPIIERSSTRNQIVMRPLAIKKLQHNYTTKTIQYDQKDEKDHCQSDTKRSQSLQHIFNSDYTSARFFSKSVERHNAIVKKDSVSSVYPPAVAMVDDFSLKMLPFIKRVLTFERTSEGKKFKSTNYTFRKQQILYSELHRPESKVEIRGWERQKSCLDEQEDYRMQDKWLNR